LTDFPLKVGALYRYLPAWSTVTYMWVPYGNQMRTWKLPRQSVMLFLGEEPRKDVIGFSLVFLCGGNKIYYSKKYSELLVYSLERIK
jgi:hypothetical protein